MRDLPELLEIQNEIPYSRSTLDWNKTPRIGITNNLVKYHSTKQN